MDPAPALVLDTAVVVAGLRSPQGASAALLLRGLKRRFTPVLSVTLVLQYEEVCLRPVHRNESGLQEREVRTIIDALCEAGRAVVTRFQWRPQLRDPGDEMVLEAAVNGRADALATSNERDFAAAPERFRIPILPPREALRRLGMPWKSRFAL